MEENVATPWWRTMLMIVAGLIGLLALSGLLMALIVGVARFLDVGGAKTGAAPATSYYSSPAPATPAQQNARTRVPQPYALQDWPDTPGRRTGTGAASARPRPTGGASGGGTQASAAPKVPVGIPVEQYEARLAAGDKVYIPNPQGECGLSGASGQESARSLTECFAARAAR